jgi:hypothetical protein
VSFAASPMAFCPVCLKISLLSSYLVYIEELIGFWQGPVCLKIKSSFQLSSFCIEELKKKRQLLQPGHSTPIGKHHPSQHELLTLFRY